MARYLGAPRPQAEAEDAAVLQGQLLKAEVVEVCEGATSWCFSIEGIFLETLERLGKMPLHFTSRAELGDPSGTDCLLPRVGSAWHHRRTHFTRALLAEGAGNGNKVCYVTLHMGLGTFRPVKEEEITDHEMHSEYCMISAETAETINRTRKREEGRSSLWALLPHHRESWAAEDGTLKVRRVDEYLHLSRLPLQGAGLSYHQFSPARIHAYHGFPPWQEKREHVWPPKGGGGATPRFFSFGDAMFSSAESERKKRETGVPGTPVFVWVR